MHVGASDQRDRGPKWRLDGAHAGRAQRLAGPVQAALAAIERDDWERLKPLLHPYLHWTTSDGETIRGRRTVLARLADSQRSSAPSSYELRDGQIYRWAE